MKQLMTSTALIVAFATTSALAATPVKEIDVEVDLTAVQDHDAAKVWADLEADLETAIAKRVVDLIDDSGARVMIDIDELELANAFENLTDSAQSAMVGEVKVRGAGFSGNTKYDLSITVEQVRAYYPSGVSVPTADVNYEDFYVAMVDAFAENVAQTLRD